MGRDFMKKSPSPNPLQNFYKTGALRSKDACFVNFVRFRAVRILEAAPKIRAFSVRFR